MKTIRKIVVLGANGAMGSGSGAVFAAAGIPTVFLAPIIFTPNSSVGNNTIN